MPLALRIDNLWKSFSAGVRGCSARVWALRDCSLSIEVGERVGIVGGPGSGKSTLLHCLAGERFDAGRRQAWLPVVAAFGLDVRSPEPSLASPIPVLALLDAPCDWLSETAGTLVVTSRDVASIRSAVHRILCLREGRLGALTSLPVRRVAERIASV